MGDRKEQAMLAKAELARIQAQLRASPGDPVLLRRAVELREAVVLKRAQAQAPVAPVSLLAPIVPRDSLFPVAPVSSAVIGPMAPPKPPIPLLLMSFSSSLQQRRGTGGDAESGDQRQSVRAGQARSNRGRDSGHHRKRLQRGYREPESSSISIGANQVPLGPRMQVFPEVKGASQAREIEANGLETGLDAPGPAPSGETGFAQSSRLPVVKQGKPGRRNRKHEVQHTLDSRAATTQASLNLIDDGEVWPGASNSTEKLPSQPHLAFWCDACNLGTDDKISMEAHLAGKRHAKNLGGVKN